MKLFHFVVVITVTILTSAFVWVRLQIVNTSYEIHDLQEKEKLVREKNNVLTMHIHQARAPYKLEALSKDKFKMGPPRTDQIIVMKDLSSKDLNKRR